jgi:amino acid adenylation domain-containing protein
MEKQFIPRIVNRDSVPLSFAQQRLWFLDQLEPDNPLYNVPTALRLSGKLNVELLRRSLDAIVARHEALRTTFVPLDGSPVQVIGAYRRVELTVIDLAHGPASEREAELRLALTEESRRPFNLSADLMVRATLARLDGDEHVLLLVTHHIASDGWSREVLFHELAVLYGAFAAGKPDPLPQLSIQYADFAVWQRERLQGKILEAQLSYWKQQLSAVPVLELPTDRPRPPVQTYHGARRSSALPASLISSLKELGRKEQVTLYMTTLAAFQTLLYRYSGQADVPVGSPIAGRSYVETEGLIGFFVNTLVLRSDLSGDPTFSELLARVRKVALESYAHQELPFEKLVEALRPDRDPSRSPLFQVMFVLQNIPRASRELTGLTVTPLEVDSGTAKFDLTLSMAETAGSLRASFEYNTDLFEQTTIDRMLGHFQTLLEGIVANPDQRLSELPLLTESERHQLLVEWNDTKREYSKDKCIHELFEEQVERTPDAVAVHSEARQLTYRELNRRANQLAHYLRKRAVGPDVIVGLCVERCLEMLVGVLGILKAGGAYLPLDPHYPKERLAFMLEDSHVPVLLTQAQQVSRFPQQTAQVICLDADWDAMGGESVENPVSGVTPDNLTYVIYTSGSTGKPKGVLVTHINVARLFAATEAWYHFDEQDVWTLFHSSAFDFSVWEIWGALLYGGRLVVVPYLISRSPEAFYELLRTEQVTVLNQTPSAFRQLMQVEDIRGAAPDLALRYVILGGETLDFRSLQRWFARHGDQRPQIVNMYGITETTVHATYHPITLADADASASIIGVRIPDLQVHVLNRKLQPVPIGVLGELHIGGDGLARGYLNRPELTAEKFIPNPFSGEPGARLYKSGDLGRYLPDGNIEFLGRLDHQVKIRGFRIELGEIEAVLGQHPGIRDAVALDREDVPADKRLVAYVVPKDASSPTTYELRNFLKEKLPEYMVPSAFVVLEALPLTSNGKVDRRALPAPDARRPEQDNALVEPRTPAETALAKIWAQVLRLERVGVHDNFFDLGGHSLLAMQVISRVREAFRVEVSLRSLFETPTVAGLAGVIQQAKDSGSESPSPKISPAPRQPHRMKAPI